MKFKIYTLGCKVNQYDSLTLKGKLKDVGFESAENSQQVDLVIVNTCSVTKKANRKDRQMIAKAKKENPEARVVVMGCWYKIYPETVEVLEADLFWPVGKLDELVEAIQGLFKNTSRLKEQEGQSPEAKISLPGKGERARYFMKVQDGCEQFCSYCVIPYSRGKLKSRGWREVIKEAQEVERAGYREINLCGIHLGLYGVNSGESKTARQKDKKLAWLIKKIIQNTNQLRVRISSIEVNDVTTELIELMKNEERFCKHFHIPLQGGEDKLLQLMNRPYDTKYFKNKINEIRKEIPDVAITADVIVGFPSETEKQFEKTIELVKELKLSKLHVFSYSKHEQTVAAKMTGQLDNKVKKERSKILRKLSDELWEEYQEKIKSQKSKFKIVIEQIREETILGKTEYYFNLEIPKEDIKEENLIIGSLITIKI